MYVGISLGRLTLSPNVLGSGAVGGLENIFLVGLRRRQSGCVQIGVSSRLCLGFRRAHVAVPRSYMSVFSAGRVLPSLIACGT